MLISIVLTLKSETEAALPAHLGRATYAATLARLQAFDPVLTRQIHDGDGPKPLTCSGLLGARVTREGTVVRAGQRYSVRVTGLVNDVSQALEASLVREQPAWWELDHQRFQVVEVTCDPAQHGWSGRTSYEALAAAQVTQLSRPDRQVTLEFVTPTSFKSKEMNVPIPLPGLVFGSLVERWNAFSPIALSSEMRRFGEEMVAVSRYRLESRAVEQKNAALRIGAVGTVTYRALGGDRYWHSVMQMLAEFALYSGVGVQTATGMGQARKQERRRGNRDEDGE